MSEPAPKLEPGSRLESESTPLVQIRRQRSTQPLHLRLADEPGRRFASHEWESLAQRLETEGSPHANLVAGLAQDWATQHYEAVAALRAWDSAGGDRLVRVLHGPEGIELELGEPATHNTNHAEPVLSGLAKAVLDGALPVPQAIGVVFMGVRALARAGDFADARAVVERGIAVERHFLFETASATLSLLEAGDRLPGYLEDVFDESTYFAERVCTLPFREFQIDQNGDVFGCCPSYLNLPIGNVREQGNDEILNSPRAHAIRQSVLDGTFTYCNRSACTYIRQDKLPKKREVTDPVLRHRIDTGDVTVKSAASVQLSLDPSCNLSCPSCRTERIIDKPDATSWKVKAVDNVILPLLRDAEELMMNGYGDIFMSPVCREVLSRISAEQYPGLGLVLLTNGTLFDERNWNRFPNAHGMIRRVRVSVDAARAKTYEIVRRGGDFTKLHHNLEFLVSLRRAGQIDHLWMSFVYQAFNFREMPEFVRWGKQLGCDGVVFEPLLDWNTFAPGEYAMHAVHRATHPDYEEFSAVLDDPALADPFVTLRR